MPTYSQESRPIAVETPLGKDALLLTAFTGHEQMSGLFRFTLDLQADKSDPVHEAPKIVGKQVTFWVEYPDGKKRYFNGFVNRFSYGGTDDRVHYYRAEVVPWLWFLTRTSDCRIFQKKSVPDIISQIFKDLGFSDFKMQVEGSSDPREYCVQYRETDFNFVSRMMEEEGIFYFFRHEHGKHTLIVSNTPSSYEDCQEKEPQFAAAVVSAEHAHHIRSWEHEYEFRTGKWAHTDYNFETPSTSLMADAKTTIPLPDAAKFEFYDYPGEYLVKADGKNYAKLRIEAEEAAYDVVRGGGHCRSFNPGGKFKLKGHATAGENDKEYVLTAVQHSARVGEAYTGGGSAGEMIYQNSFYCIPSSLPCRPARQTPKPVVHGVQTAVVVGPSGEEINTDKYGRIKVQFHWDREGKKDDNSSCWIRVAQTSAGKGWGSMMLPRIGQEVVVTYLEGDPDRPLVTGVVYNAHQMPAYPPEEKTKWGFKSNSSPGGSGFNEIRLDDKAGNEQFYLHAQKDMDVLVLHDQRQEVVNDQSLVVGRDAMETIGRDNHVAIGRTVHETIGKDLHETIGGDHHVTLEKSRIEKIGKDISLTAKGNVKQDVQAWYLVAKKMHAKLDVEAALEAKNIHIKAATSLVLEAGIKLSLKVGGNFVDVSATGVAINGTPVLVNSGGAAGAGGGCSPESPDAPTKADPKKPDECDKTAKSGQKSAS